MAARCWQKPFPALECNQPDITSRFGGYLDEIYLWLGNDPYFFLLSHFMKYLCDKVGNNIKKQREGFGEIVL